MVLANAVGSPGPGVLRVEEVVLDLATGKTTATPFNEGWSQAKWNRTGTGLIVGAGATWKRAEGLFTAALPDLAVVREQTVGLPSAVCPTADVVCVWAFGNDAAHAVLYDLAKHEEIAEFPVNPVNPRDNKLGYWECQWTADGRYLYYCDLFETGVWGTRVWDREEKGDRTLLPVGPEGASHKRVLSPFSSDIESAVPLGPGPTPTSVVLAKLRNFVDPSAGFVLHDASTGKTFPLGDETMALIHAHGRNVLYAKKNAQGVEVPYLAEIDMTGRAKAAPASAPVAAGVFPEKITVAGQTIECRTVEEIRKLGFECDEIPWQENAARVYVDAFNAYKRPADALERTLASFTRQLDFAGNEEEARKHFEENKPALDLLKQAAAMPRCQFPMARAQWVSKAPLFWFPPAQFLARELSYRSAFDLTQGRIREAVDGSFVAMQLGVNMGNNRSLIWWLVGVACEGLGGQSLERIVATHNLDEAALKDVAERLAKVRMTFDDYARALRGERAGTAWTLSDLRELGIEAMIPDSDMTLAQRAAWRLGYDPATTRKNMMSIYDFCDARAKMPTWEALRPENGDKEFVRKNKADWDMTTQSIAISVRPGGEVLHLGVTYVVNAKRLAQFEALEIRVALERFRLAKKAWPEELAELKPNYLKEVPVDPFSGAPWGYRVDADGEFTLWSVGEDLKDDDGKKVDDWTPDIVFTSRKAP
jgi:hypothetical protein